MTQTTDLDMPKKRREIQSINKAFLVLEYVVSHPDGVSLAALSRELEMNRHTAFQILSTLCSCGYLLQEKASKNYFAGSRLLWLSNTNSFYSHLISLAKPIMYELSNKTKETIHLAVLDGVHVRFLDRLESTQPLSVVTDSDTPLEAHITSVGKAILAHLPEGQLADLLAQMHFVPYTARTICCAEALQDELQLVREIGYATDNEEHFLGVRCVAAPIRDEHGKVLCSIGISAPAVRLPDFQVMGRLVQDAAKELEEKLTGQK